MKAISVTEKEVQAAFSVAKSEETKQVLTALFGPQEEKVKPTLDDYTTIKTYEDACEALGISPILSEHIGKVVCAAFANHYDFRQNMPDHLIALMKLEVVSRALWGRDWEPKPSAYGTIWYYFPSFTLCTKDELDRLTKTQRDTLISTSAGEFGYLSTMHRSSFAFTYFEIRLCQETEEKAEYFGRQFIELWAEYLKFNFEVK